MLRSRRREELTDMAEFDTFTTQVDGSDPEDQAALADSVGLALLVVLDALGPAERVAFVLHDLFAVPFDEIAPIVERSPVAAKKLASRARRRVHGRPAVAAGDLEKQRAVVDAFLAASVLAPDVVRTAEPAVPRDGVEREIRGGRRVAEETLTNTGRARYARAALVNGALGAIVAPRGRLLLVLELVVEGDRIVAVNVISDPQRLRQLELSVLDDAHGAKAVISVVADCREASASDWKPANPGTMFANVISASTKCRLFSATPRLSK
jgi:hypothetical protein